MTQTATSIAPLLTHLRRLSSAPNASLVDPEIRRARDAFKEACVEALTTDYEAAHAEDVERKLWRFAFYAPISDFRARLAAPALAAAGAAPASPAAKLRAKTLAAYLKFLQDSEALYEGLAEHFCAATAAAPAPARRRLRAALARALICVGDLRRYAAVGTASTDDAQQQQPDWGAARAAYAAAAGADPSAGNAFNQLGVLDEAEGASLTAAFFYLRAQLAGTPFAAARHNATLLFAAAQGATEGEGPQKGGTRGRWPKEVLENELSFSYLRQYAFLYEQLDVDATPRRMAAAAANLEELVNRLKQQSNAGGAAAAARRVGQAAAGAPASVAAAVGARPVSPPLLVVSLGLLLVHAAEASTMSPKGGSDGAAPAAAAAKCYALSVVLDALGRLSTAASKLKLGDAAPLCDAALTSPLLPAVAVVVRWLAAADAAPALPGGAAPPAVEATIQGLHDSRAAAWKGLAALVSALALSPAVRSLAQHEDALTASPLPEDLFLAGFPPLESPDDPESEPSWAKLDAAAAAAGAALAKDPSSAAVPGRRRAVRLWNDLQALAAAAGAWRAAHGGGAGVDGVASDEFVQAAAAAAIAARQGASSTPAGSKRSEGGSRALPTALPSAAAGRSAPEDQHQAMEDDEEEEVILFAPAMGPRRASSAALLSGSSGRGTPAPGAEAAPPAAMDVDIPPAAAAAAVVQTTAAGVGAVAAPVPSPLLSAPELEEDPQTAMERTFHDMAAQVLGSDDVDNGFAAAAPAPPPPPMPTFLGGPSPTGLGGGVYSGAYFGAAPPSQLFSGLQGGLFPGVGAPWPGGGPSPLAAPPIHSPTLPPPPIAAGQHPAEGLRAVLFGGAAPAAGPPLLGDPSPPPPDPRPGMWAP